MTDNRQYPPDWPTEPEPIRMLTPQQAADLTGRPIRVIQTWVSKGILPATRQPQPHPSLIALDDLVRVSLARGRWGVKRTPAKRHITRNGKTVMLRGQVPTKTGGPLA